MDLRREVALSDQAVDLRPTEPCVFLHLGASHDPIIGKIRANVFSGHRFWTFAVFTGPLWRYLVTALSSFYSAAFYRAI